MQPPVINLNSDLGESFGPWSMGDDEAMLDIVASANIACGFHAGDPQVMSRTVAAALARKVSIGAHPSFPDLQGFGRRTMNVAADEIEAIVAYQIGALAGIAARAGGKVSHVKPHGALNNMAAGDIDLARALARAVRAVDPGLIFLAPAGSAMVTAAREAGLAVALEIYADRAYQDDGSLVPRSRPGALIENPGQAAAAMLDAVISGRLTSLSGKTLQIEAQSISVHGDSPSAVAMARAVRDALGGAGIAIAPLPALSLSRNDNNC